MPKKRFEIDWDAQPLGKLADMALARQLGCSHTLVWLERRKRKIPAFGTFPIDWTVQPLGQVPDVELAARLRTTVAAVRCARYRRDLPTYRERELARQRELLQRDRLELLHHRYELTANEIGAMLGLDGKLVYRTLVKLGLQRTRDEVMGSPRMRMRISESLRRRSAQRKQTLEEAAE